MANENGYEIASMNPGWIHKKKPKRYLDENFTRIIVFFVINTPCMESSSSGINIKEYGWDKNTWRNSTLKNKLFDVAGLKRDETFVVAKRVDLMKNACEKGKVKKNFHKARSIEKVVIYKSRSNEFLSICNHIRNSFAHGRFSIYEENGEEIFVMEDGVVRNGKFQVRSRMILKKSTLVKWIDILEKGPVVDL